MRILLTTLLTTCCLALPLAAASASEPVKKSPVREVDPMGLNQQPRTKFEKPIVITSADQLEEKVVLCRKGGGHDLLIRLRKDVDFAKEQLLFFAWSGSEQDRLTYEIKCCPKHRDDVTEVTFQYQRGTTEDGRSHFRLFVLPKNTPWSVADVKSTPK